MSMERRGLSYDKRVANVNAVYDAYVKTGLSNREIWKRYVWPRWGMSERTFYNMLYAPARPGVTSKNQLAKEGLLFPEEEFQDSGRSESKTLDFFRKMDH